ncbi:hypothetical protein LSTR_LSTR015554 [Laodelphax striatellus]|uniref:CUB domain-containing protein n=1 Tax=Laodelphax striatellus TaxID=195883 RepID=A0A482X2R8_LAOST|nr:hypothetical protein LSTR_LSTR015554 [Laodelphax striatellus]
MSGLISSPFYPKFYPRQGTFEWRITVTYGMVIRAAFVNLQMENAGSDYSENYVQDVLSAEADHNHKFIEKPGFFDGFDGPQPVTAERTGAILPTRLRSTGKRDSYQVGRRASLPGIRSSSPGLRGHVFDSLTLVLNAEMLPVYQARLLHRLSRQTRLVNVSHSLHMAAYEAHLDIVLHLWSVQGCGGQMFVSRVTGFNGTARFSSPGFPDGYDSMLNCVWTVETAVGFKLHLEFSTLDLEASENCEADYVQVAILLSILEDP